MLRAFRAVRTSAPVKPGQVLLYAAVFLALGLLLGIAAKWLDLYGGFLGTLFSRIMIWFLLCVGIAGYSKTPLTASCNVFLFCLGMLCTYYLSAIWWEVVWSRTFVYGWLVFSLGSPVFAFFTWYAKGRGWFALLLKAGILAVSLAAETLLFGFRFYNVVLAALIAFVLFEKRSRKGNDHG